MSQEWERLPIQPFSTIKAAIEKARQHEHGRWKWAKPSGNCIRTAYLACNAHIQCGVKLMVSQMGGDFFMALGSMKSNWACVSIKLGEHSTTDNLYKRKNSALTWEEERTLRDAVEIGGRAGQVKAVLLNKEVSRLKGAGEKVLDHKRPEGGLEGALNEIIQ